MIMLMMAFALELLTLGDCSGARPGLWLPWEQQQLLVAGGRDMEPRSDKQLGDTRTHIGVEGAVVLGHSHVFV